MKRPITFLLLLILSGCAAPSAHQVSARRSGVDPSRPEAPMNAGEKVGGAVLCVVALPLLWATTPIWLVALPIDKMKHDAAEEKAKSASQPERPVNPLPQTS